MKPLDSKVLKKFLQLAGNELEGDWIIIGGTILPLLGVNHRATTDIDFLPLGKTATNETLLSLIKLAEKLGLAIESINSAGLYFLEKIPRYSEEIVLLHKGKSANIYRPNVNLFLKLKIARLNEADLMDCLDMIKYAKRNGEQVQKTVLIKLLEQEIKNSTSAPDRQGRLKKILSLVK